ncbi:hypothetical protein AGMMS50249_1490 [candidate division SR1 bacterium]|nr:hypothetical protein AGMMS50249_1490 [candidate division SR1 bacterium]
MPNTAKIRDYEFVYELGGERESLIIQEEDRESAMSKFKEKHNEELIVCLICNETTLYKEDKKA